MDDFNIGSKAYIPDGRAVCVTGLAQHGYFVSELYEDHEGDTCIDEESNSFFVRNLYAEIPDPVKDGRITALEASIKEKRTELQRLENDIAHQKKEIQSICAMYEPLSYLKDFFDGTLSYAVLWSDYHLTIGPVPEILKTGDRYDWPKVRLVSLFGRNGKDLEWRVSKYTDGSDRHYPENISFHRTELEARDHAKKIAEERFSAFRKKNQERCNVDDLVLLGIPIPNDIQAANLAYEKNALAEAKRRAEQDMARAQESYNAARAKYEDLEGQHDA